MIRRTIFNEEHEIFRDAVRRFIEVEITPYHDQWDKDGVVPRELWLKAGEAGLLCSNVEEEYGGPGADFLLTWFSTKNLPRRLPQAPALPSTLIWLPCISPGSVMNNKRKIGCPGWYQVR